MSDLKDSIEEFRSYPDELAEGFHRLDEKFVSRNPPRINLLPGFYEKTEEAQRLYLIRLASTMNHAAKLIQDERDKLVKLMEKKEQQLEQMASQVAAVNVTMQSLVADTNEKRQQMHQNVADLNTRIRELEDGANG